VLPDTQSLYNRCRSPMIQQVKNVRLNVLLFQTELGIFVHRFTVNIRQQQTIKLYLHNAEQRHMSWIMMMR
jgi:hypothetical protein